ncbi:MAG TPA: helix-turn-helix transcriptional regulator [Acidimicrobiales bacterium]
MAVAPSPATVRRRRDDLVRRAHRADDPLGVFAAASTTLRDLVPFDAAVWLTTDPLTGLPTAPTRVDDLGDVTPEMCSEHWHHEFVVDDVLLFRDLARAERPAGALRSMVRDPRASARYRTFLQPRGFEDELRALLRVGDAPWGSLSLWRRDASKPFTRKETALLAGLAAPLGEALRGCARVAQLLGEPLVADEPGMMLFDGAAQLVSVNEQARAWLDDAPPDVAVPTDLGIEVPMWLYIVVQRARGVMHGVGDGTARARIRNRRGVWMMCHASSLWDADGCIHNTAVVLEPAKPAEIAPIVVEAYDLSPREQQITRLIVRGLGTADMASELHLSRHTVRDHVKVIFQKVGVSRRGELVAKLFAQHYEPAHLRGVVRHEQAG